MRLKIYAITYNDNHVLNDWLLYSLNQSEYDRLNTQVFIIDNHTNAKISPEYAHLATIITNHLRPNCSHGFLSRSYNQAILNGFLSLKKPDCDFVVTLQNDTVLNPYWYEYLNILIKKYEYVSQGMGDQLQVYSADAIKHIGLFDERFSGIGFQESDYFLRAKKYYGNKSSITDRMHNHMLNPTEHDLIKPTTVGYHREKPFADPRSDYYDTFTKIFVSKWKDQNFYNLKPEGPAIPAYMYYPWFEKDIVTLEAQNYVI